MKFAIANKPQDKVVRLELFQLPHDDRSVWVRQVDENGKFIADVCRISEHGIEPRACSGDIARTDKGVTKVVDG